MTDTEIANPVAMMRTIAKFFRSDMGGGHRPVESFWWANKSMQEGVDRWGSADEELATWDHDSPLRRMYNWYNRGT